MPCFKKNVLAVDHFHLYVVLFVLDLVGQMKMPNASFELIVAKVYDENKDNAKVC